MTNRAWHSVVLAIVGLCVSAWGDTVVVDGTAILDLQSAYERLSRNDGEADVIDVKVNRTTERKTLWIAGSDDLTINGNADGDGSACTVVSAGGGVLVSIAATSSTSYTLNDLVLVPAHAGGDVAEAAIAYACEQFPSKAKVLLNSVTITASAAGDVAVAPAAPPRESYAAWTHALRLFRKGKAYVSDTGIEMRLCTVAHTRGNAIEADELWANGFLFEIAGCEFRDIGGSAIAFTKGWGDVTWRLSHTLFAACERAILFEDNGENALLHVGPGCIFHSGAGPAAIDFRPSLDGKTVRLLIQGTEKDPVTFLNKVAGDQGVLLLHHVGADANYQVDIRHTIFACNSGRAIELRDVAGEKSYAKSEAVLFAENAEGNVRFEGKNITASFKDSAFHNTVGGDNQIHGPGEGNQITYTNCTFSGDVQTRGAHTVDGEQKGVKIAYVDCTIATGGPGAMGAEFTGEGPAVEKKGDTKTQLEGGLLSDWQRVAFDRMISDTLEDAGPMRAKWEAEFRTLAGKADPVADQKRLDLYRTASQVSGRYTAARSRLDALVAERWSHMLAVARTVPKDYAEGQAVLAKMTDFDRRLPQMRTALDSFQEGGIKSVDAVL
ncbi:hypothetical protein HQ560_06700, partial [bacterium]|nr:hypothetical protein [bacterium]